MTDLELLELIGIKKTSAKNKLVKGGRCNSKSLTKLFNDYKNSIAIEIYNDLIQEINKRIEQELKEREKEQCI